MFDKLDDILIHYEELMQELGNPSVTEDQNRDGKGRIIRCKEADRSAGAGT